MPCVSVVIPSFNHGAYIKEAVESVLHQTTTDLELIIVDDGSTDQSLEILSTFSDPRMRVIPQENQGAHAAINRGLEESRGKFLAILDSDDAYHPKRLEKAMAVLEENERVGLVGSFIHIVDDHNRTLGIKHGYQDCEPWLLEAPEYSFRAGLDLRAALLTENYWSTTSNFVFPRRWYEQIGAFRSLRFAHDWDFALRLAKTADLRLLAEPLVNYRVHEKNTIRDDQAAMVFEICWCLAVHLPAHVKDTCFFEKLPLDVRVEQLLHSIYVFDCEQVLNVMLLQQLHDNPNLALELLQPENPIRTKYLRFIQERLESRGKSEISPQDKTMDSSSGKLFDSRKFRSWLRNILIRF